MFFSGGGYSSLGAGRLLVKESIWLDSLTNCIKRQSCPWSAPQLIDGSTHLHRKSSRQNGGKSVACLCSPPSCARYLCSPIFPHSASFHTKCHTSQTDSKQSQILFNLYMFGYKLRKRASATHVLIRHFICKFAVRIEWQWVYFVRLLQIFLKRTTVCVDEAESNSLFILNQLCRHPARYHHLVMWKTRHRQAHSLKPKVNGTWEIKTTSLWGWDELRKWQSSLGRPHHCLFLVKNTTGFFLKAPPLIRSDQLTCALNFPSGRTGVK